MIVVEETDDGLDVKNIGNIGHNTVFTSYLQIWGPEGKRKRSIFQILPQPRKNFREIPKLMYSIGSKGLLIPLDVAIFTPQEA